MDKDASREQRGNGLQVLCLPILIGLTAITGVAAVAYYFYHRHFVRGVKVREISGAHLCPRCGRRLTDVTSNCPECNKKLRFPKE